MRTLDPKRSISSLQTGQSAKSMFCKLECSEAAIDDFTLRVGTRTSPLRVHRRKAAVGVSLPGSSPSLLNAADPEETLRLFAARSAMQRLLSLAGKNWPGYERRVTESSSRTDRLEGSPHFKCFLMKTEPALSDTSEFLFEFFGQALWPAEPDFGTARAIKRSPQIGCA
jgi:hypothetical protein